MIYVTSDLHGIHPDKFQDFLDRCGFTDEDFLFILGDVIDRGEHGIPLLLWLTQQSNMQLILGNHEAFLLGCQFLFDEVTEETQEVLGEEELRMLKNWLRNGGSPTILGLQSLFNRDPELVYGIVDYLKDAPLWEQAEAGGRNFILVHGGLGNFHPDKPMDSYTPRSALGAAGYQLPVLLRHNCHFRTHSHGILRARLQRPGTAYRQLDLYRYRSCLRRQSYAAAAG